jgi:hypothetical protein
MAPRSVTDGNATHGNATHGIWAKIAATPAKIAATPAKIDATPFSEDCLEKQKHFRKTNTITFKEKSETQVESENAVGKAVYACGFSWADE